MRLIIILTIFFLAFSGHVEAWKHFWRGKSIGKVKEQRIGPPDQWFQQKLDHLDVINDKTWQQVISFLY